MEDTQQSQNIAHLEGAPNSIFISYSRKDKKYLEEFHTHLALYVRKGAIMPWDDTKILPGSKWAVEIDRALQTARIAVFLVSANFLASDFIATNEMTPLLQAAQQKGVMILSVVLSACAFKYSELGPFQAFNDPSTPLNQMTRAKRDVVWQGLARFIQKQLTT
jgi:internalin A